jgi:hypothetical protein
VSGDAPAAGPGPDAGEEAAWADLGLRWDDAEAHRGYLSRFPDLEGLARAGARYRAVLSERPDDPAALAGRDEVVRRATVLGLAAMPRTAPPPRSSPWGKRGAWLALVAFLGVAVAAAAIRLLRPGALR